MKEQEIKAEDEWDSADENARHLLAIYDHKPIGCARILEGNKIGRIAVLKGYRAKGIGSKLLRAAISRIQKVGGNPALNAQIKTMGFYANHGFLPCGPVFREAGILHRLMTLTGDVNRSLMPLDAKSLRFDTPTLLVAIEPKLIKGEMRINLPRLDDDDSNWLIPRLCCYAVTHNAHTLIFEIPEGTVKFPLEKLEDRELMPTNASK